MSAITVDGVPVVPEPQAQARVVATRNFKSTIVMGIATVVLALIALLGQRPGDTNFSLSSADGTDAIKIPILVVPGETTALICVGITAALTVVAALMAVKYRRFPLWASGVAAVVWVVGFLAWAGAGASATVFIVGLLSGGVVLSIPIVFGALGGVIGERAGVVNIAIEAQLLLAAFTSALLGSITGSAWVGLLGASAAGMLVAWVLGVFAIKYRAEQVIIGVVLNVIVLGLTSFFFKMVIDPNRATLNNAGRFPSWKIPLLGDIPIIGPTLFNQRFLGFLMFVMVIVVWFALYRTRWGLRTRAVGEHPKAADTVGIKVAGTRYRAVLIAGAIAGLGGAAYTVAGSGRFGENATAGAGFIALASVIFGKWHPVKAALAGLLFGVSYQMNFTLSAIGSPVPQQFMQMLPYVVTLLAVAGLVGRSRAPAADGLPYSVE
jgi:simple sugar transport system permease protein